MTKRQFKYTPGQVKAAIMLREGKYSPSWISFKLHDLRIAKVGAQMVSQVVNGNRFNSKVVAWIEEEFADELAVVSKQDAIPRTPDGRNGDRSDSVGGAV